METVLDKTIGNTYYAIFKEYSIVDNEKVISYGILANDISENAVVHNVTTMFEKIHDIFKLCVDNHVSVVHICDTIVDIIS